MPNLRLQHKALFRVSAGPFDDIAFMKCSAIRVESELVTHRAGGTLLANKMPGLVTVPPVTLDRGFTTPDNSLYDWFKRVTDLRNLDRNINLGRSFQDASDSNVTERMDLKVEFFRRSGGTSRVYILKNAFPTVFEIEELDNDANEVLIERIVLEYDYPILAEDSGDNTGTPATDAQASF